MTRVVLKGLATMHEKNMGTYGYVMNPNLSMSSPPTMVLSKPDYRYQPTSMVHSAGSNLSTWVIPSE